MTHCKNKKKRISRSKIASAVNENPLVFNRALEKSAACAAAANKHAKYHIIKQLLRIDRGSELFGLDYARHFRRCMG